MSRTSRSLCFLLAVTVVNVVIYLAMSGSFTLVKNPVGSRTTNLHTIRQASREVYQDRMSRLVKEAMRDRGLSRQNLTVMLEMAMMEHVDKVEDRHQEEAFIHRGKTEAINRTVPSLMALFEEDEVNKDPQKPAGNLPNWKFDMDVEEVGTAYKEKEKESNTAVRPPEPHEVVQEGGFLSQLGKLFPSAKDVNAPAVVFPHNYNVVMNEPNKCKNEDGSDKPVYFLVLIMSIHKNFDQRNAIRKTWGSPKEVDGKQIVTLFLLAKNRDSRHQRLVDQESRQYHDLLMEDFDDTYKNLTRKTMMAMKWASIFCPHAQYVMKTDDDMYVSYANLIKHLAKPLTPRKSYVSGMVINGGPIRDPKSKWYMPRETYPGSKYPPFCSGTGYVMSGDMPGRIFEISLQTPFLYLEDVYVAVCLDSLHVVPVNHREFNNWRTAYSYCRYKRIFTTHMVTPTEMYRIWSDQKTSKGYHCTI